MKFNSLQTIRFWFEIIALPIFTILVIHLGGEGFWSLLNVTTEHSHNTEEMDTAGSFADILFNRETLTGIILCLFFVAIWRKTFLKKWIPCTHEHCHHDTSKTPHILAIVALCIHFFPEAGIRYKLLSDIYDGEIFNILGILGFIAHLLVDIVIMVFLSLYWKSRTTCFLSFLIIFFCWVSAFLIGEHVMNHIPVSFEGWILLGSAFLLAMFIHKPHKPVIACNSCDSD